MTSERKFLIKKEGRENRESAIACEKKGTYNRHPQVRHTMGIVKKLSMK
jgi:hypothetical protein